MGVQTRCRCDFPSHFFSQCPIVWVRSDPVSISTFLQFCVPQNGKHSYEQVNWVACVCLQQGLFISTQTLSTPGLDKVLGEILMSVKGGEIKPSGQLGSAFTRAMAEATGLFQMLCNFSCHLAPSLCTPPACFPGSVHIFPVFPPRTQGLTHAKRVPYH